MRPYDHRLIDKWDNRAAAFFASVSFVLATLGTNVCSSPLVFMQLTRLLLNDSRSQRIHSLPVTIWRRSAHATSISGAGKSFVRLLEAGLWSPGQYWRSEYIPILRPPCLPSPTPY